MSELGAYIFDGGYLDWECTVLFTEFDNVTESVMVYGRARHSTDELTYELNDTGDGYIVIDKGATKGAIVIPEVYQGLPVVGIGDYAFAEDLIDVLSSRYVTSVRHTNLQYDFEGYSV
ncbi:MAG: hypothetical protein LBP79_02055 [Clostridiales bacterium]|nr:hypothetical protein [Clostridiales bacterium]